jgi:hypothetical protein
MHRMEHIIVRQWFGYKLRIQLLCKGLIFTMQKTKLAVDCGFIFHEVIITHARGNLYLAVIPI